MSKQMKYNGNVPGCIFIVANSENKEFWIYTKEGHAINRMLGERKSGHAVEMIRFVAIKSEQ